MMNTHFLSRHPQHLASLHLADYGDGPSTVGRILYFALPTLFFVVMFAVFGKQQKINNKFPIYPLNSYKVRLITAIISLLVILAALESLISNSWSTRSWMLYAAICLLVGLYFAVYQTGMAYAILICVLLVAAAGICSEYLFVRLEELAQGTQFVEMLSRNIVGWMLVQLIVRFGHHFGQVLVYVIGFSRKCQAVFFWLTVPLFLILVLVGNLINFGPFLASIGYIIHMVIKLVDLAIQTRHNINDDLLKFQDR